MKTNSVCKILTGDRFTGLQILVKSLKIGLNWTKDCSEQQLSKQQAWFHLCWECQAPKYANNKGVKVATDMGSTC